MKLKHILTLGAMAAALALGTSNLMAQDDNGGGGNGGNGGGIRGGGNGGGGFGGGGGGGGRNFDPAARQQMMMQGIQDRLGFTNDTDWQAVQPLVQKVLDARRDVGGPNMRAIFGGRNRNGGGGGGQGGGPRGGGGFGGFGGQPSPEETALQDALDNNAPSAQIKDLLTKFKAAQKAKQAKLIAAQEDLKKVLTSKQEAQAYMWGLVD